MNATAQLKRDVLIVGSGECAWRIARNLATHRIPVWITASGAVPDDRKGIHVLEEARLTDCTGYAGEFEVRLQQNGQPVRRQVAAIALAAEEKRRPNYAAYGLEPAVQIHDISTLENRLCEKPLERIFAPGGCVAFFNGWQEESHPVVTARILAACLALQKNKTAQTFFITGNLKVADDGLEALCQEAKTLGTVFVKCTGQFPELQVLTDGSIQIDYWDELTRGMHQLKVDAVVVDETVEADPMLAHLARALDVEVDPTGFAQGDNVRRWSNYTNRRGIFTAGSARCILSPAQKRRDADQAAMEILKFLYDGDKEDLPQVEIVRGRCARCLTCHRLCPHQAIDIGSHISVVAQACQSCGICAAGCPARAIEIQGVHFTQLRERISHLPESTKGAEAFEPRLVLFCCSRSAGQAHRLASDMGACLPSGTTVVDVPCGGAVSVKYLLGAFDAGADGVMLCTCHQDNCRSQQGSSHARKRVDAALDILNMAGMESERLQVFGLAANMGAEFVRAVEVFYDTIHALGPWG